MKSVKLLKSKVVYILVKSEPKQMQRPDPAGLTQAFLPLNLL